MCPHGSALPMFGSKDDPNISICRCEPQCDNGRVIANPYVCAHARLLSPQLRFKGTSYLDCGRPCETTGNLALSDPEQLGSSGEGFVSGVACTTASLLCAARAFDGLIRGDRTRLWIALAILPLVSPLLIPLLLLPVKRPVLWFTYEVLWTHVPAFVPREDVVFVVALAEAIPVTLLVVTLRHLRARTRPSKTTRA